MALETLPARARRAVTEPPADLARLFHRLNNQLGVILANAELLEARLSDDTQKARASHVVAGALEAMSTIQELRRQLDVANGDAK